MQIFVCKLAVLLYTIGNKAAKPKQCLSATGTTKMLRQAGRIMKLTAVLLLGVCMQIYAAGYGQKITLSERDVPIEKVLKKIQAQTSYKFLYTSQLLSGVPKVTVVVKDATVQDVLDLVLKGQMLDYEVSDETVVIKPRKEVPVKEVTELNMPDPIEVRGVITDENGVPASGVNVMVKGTSKGTTTNLRGEFVLRDVSENAVLLISSVGYDRQEILVKGKSMINSQLKVAVGNLDEMQVIGYGTISKRFSTGNITTVKAVEIERQPVQNVLLTLQGRVPGLFITQSTGLPGSGVTVRIQGQNSMSRGNDPLYVIDGVPFASQNLQNIGNILGGSGLITGVGNLNGNPLSYINPNNIERIDVLKDADATAIYGSRGANGVILITTKSGKAGRTKVDINLQSGWGKVTRKLDVLNTEQYLEMRREAKKNSNSAIGVNDFDINGTWDTTRFTDWQNVLIGGTAKYTDVQSVISGGNTMTQFIVGGGYHKETTVFPGDIANHKGSIHFSINNISTNQKFRLKLSGNYMIDNNKLIERDLTSDAIRIAPNAPSLYNDDGSLNWAPLTNGSSTWTNPLAYLNNKYKNKTSNLLANAIISYDIFKGMQIRASLGYTSLQSNETSIGPLVAVLPENRTNTNRVAQYNYNNMDSWVIEPQGNYRCIIGKGGLEVLAGATIQQTNSWSQRLFASGFNSDLVLEDIRSAATLSAPFPTIASIYKYNAVFGRINYNWEDKYILNLTARRDGSSRFGSENLFNNFGSVAASWVFSKLKFIQRQSPVISFGKLKASYGTSGNDQIGDYQFMNLYAPIQGIGTPYQGASGLAPDRLPNPHVQWEETKKMQFGIDVGLFKDRLFFNVNYFHNRSSNQLLSYTLPIITGFSSIEAFNLPATVQNSGWEFVNSIRILSNKNLTWFTSFNLTVPKNKLVAFDNFKQSPYSTLYEIGKPITIWKVFHFLGVDPTAGRYIFADKNGNSTFTPDVLSGDNNVIINTAPKFYGGFENSFKFKGFELVVLFQFVKQIGKNYIFGDRPGRFFGRSNIANQPVSVLKRWQKLGDVTEIQQFNSTYPSALNTAYFNASNTSDAAWSDASYVRLKNFSLSWQLPESWKKKAYLKDVKFYLHGQNLVTITNYQGMDPETLSSTTMPPLRVLTMGLQVSF